MKIINLTAITTVPNEAGEKEIQEALSVDEQEIDYDALGLKPPKGNKIDEDGNIRLKEEHLQDIALDLSIPLENIDSYVEATDGGTLIYTKSNIQYHVAEETFEIDAYIKYIEMNWFEKGIAVFKSFLRQIKWYFSKERKIMLQTQKNNHNNLAD